MTTGFLGIPVQGGTPREVATVVNRINQGKINCTGTVTLTASATSTTLTDPRLGPNSVIQFMPTTANAATALANVYVTDQGKGTAKINHSSSANTDMDFLYAILG